MNRRSLLQWWTPRGYLWTGCPSIAAVSNTETKATALSRCCSPVRSLRSSC